MALRYRVDDLVIDAGARQVFRDGRILPVSGLTFDLLWALVRAAPSRVPAEELLQAVWPLAVVAPETLTQRVKLLRRALGDTGDGARYIKNERGRGYRLAAPAHPQSDISLAATAPDDAGSLAVMPFSNLTGDARHDCLSEGLTEELVASLGRIPGLRVPSRSSTLVHQGLGTDSRGIGKDLGVAMLLEGSIRSIADRLRVNVRLVDTHSGLQLWSNMFEREFNELFDLQDELARQIVLALRRHLDAAIRQPRTRVSGTQDVAAYRLYLQARMANRGTKDSVSRSLSLIDQALNRDPNFAAAMAYRAVLQAGGVMLRGLPPEMIEEPQQFAQRALEACEDLADAHMALGLIRAMRGAWIESAERFRAAMVIEPSSSVVRNMHALAVLRPTGRLTEALSELRHSYGVSPAEGFTAHEFAITHSLMGHDEEALRYVELTQTLSGMATHWDLNLVRARAASRCGDYAKAARYAVDALPDVLHPAAGIDVMHSLYGALQHPAGRNEAAARITGLIDSLMLPGVDGRTRIFFVTGLVMLGDLDAAWAAIQRMLERAGAFVSQIDWSDLWSPEMLPLRRDRRFHSLISRLQFEPYWQRFGPADFTAMRTI
ncbi:MAG TPA: winged helix-turn-helix domain-containing protein [Steroidobacteraceae bacterium]